MKNHFLAINVLRLFTRRSFEDTLKNTLRGSNKKQSIGLSLVKNLNFDGGGWIVNLGLGLALNQDQVSCKTKTKTCWYIKTKTKTKVLPMPTVDGTREVHLKWRGT